MNEAFVCMASAARHVHDIHFAHFDEFMPLLNQFLAAAAPVGAPS
jgi:hypothetical protein